MFGYDFESDHDALVAGDKPRVDRKTPRQSLMLAKPTSSNDDHGGGHRIDIDSWQYRLLLRWIEAGAPSTDTERDPSFVRIEVLPEEILFAKPGQSAALKVLSHWSDGTIEDVTPICRFQTNDETVAQVDASGRVTAVGRGDTHVVAFYDNGVVPVSVMMPVSDRTGPEYPATPTPTKIDELVVAKLRKLGLVPSELCSDAEFLRRVSLDMTGTLPRVEEIRAFLADQTPDKRLRKIDELLERPAYAAWWSTRLCDVMGNNERFLPINDGIPNHQSEQWYRWLMKRLAANRPYDEIVAQIVLAVSRTRPDQKYADYCREALEFAQGKQDYTARETMAHFWARSNMRLPNEKALAFSYAFLGVRLQCAECHKHPFDQWSQQDFQHFTAFFNRIDVAVHPADGEMYDHMRRELGLLDLKGPDNNNANRKKLVERGIKEGKTVPINEVYIFPANGERKGGSGIRRVVGQRIPKVLGGDEALAANLDDPRTPLMEWLRDKDNPYFARAIVNRVWANYFGTGIVEPVDDMNLANAPSNKALLDWLADEFVAQGYDLKWLHRTIATSRTYQLSWKPNATNRHDARNFSHALARRMPAELVFDAIVSATAGSEQLDRRAANPADECSIGLVPGYTGQNLVRIGAKRIGYALSVFGKPMRETPCDCERSNEPTLLQTVYLRNDAELLGLIERADGWLATLQKRLAGKANEAIASIDGAIEEAYLRTFSRLPTADERATARQYLTESETPIEGLADLLWSMFNSKEFVVNH